MKLKVKLLVIQVYVICVLSILLSVAGINAVKNTMYDVFLQTVLIGCVDCAKENNVEVITAELMAIINDKRSKQKNKK